MTQRSSYTIEVFDASGNRLADVSTYCTKRHFVIRRNRAEVVELSFDQGQLESLASTLGTSVPQLLAPGINEIRISRGNRVLIGSQIAYLAASVDNRQRTLELRAVGYLDLLHDRQLSPLLTLDYTGAPVDLGVVCTNWITQTQTQTNGSFGLTIGTIQTSRNTNTNDKWPPYGMSIRDGIYGITQRRLSIDIEITPFKVFNVYYPGIGTVHNDLLFTYPGNIKSLRLPLDATGLGNRSINRGSGNGDQQLVENRNDLNAQAIYKVRERLDDHPSCNVVTTLDDYGDESLRKYATPTAIPDVTLDGNVEPFLGAYWIGDWVPFQVSAGSSFAALNGQTLRINEIDVTVDQNDSEDIRLKVGYA